MNCFKKQHTIEYNTIGADDDDIVVVEQQHPVPMRNSGRRMKTATVLVLSAVAAAGLLLVAVVAAAVVLHGGQSYHAGSIEGGHGTPSAAAEVMVVASTRYQDRRDPCVVPPAKETWNFGGSSFGPGCQHEPFETCWKAGEGSYCWTRSYATREHPSNPSKQCSCRPNGGAWRSHSAKDLHPNHQCGGACQDITWH